MHDASTGFQEIISITEVKDNQFYLSEIDKCQFCTY